MRESKRGVTCDRTPAVQDFSDMIGGHIELTSKFSSAHAAFLKLFGQMFSRMNRTDCHVGSPDDNRQSPHLMDQSLPLAAQSRFSIGR